VEIGSWKGKSTIWLAKGAKAGSQNEVFAIDPHQGSKAHTDEGEESTYPTFLTNLEKAHVPTFTLCHVLGFSFSMLS